ncbi:MAG: hypothetical protein FWG16_02605 [Micrococcales bacterium]|nr:hypothetical protein [Micrococcales bacterium]
MYRITPPAADSSVDGLVLEVDGGWMVRPGAQTNPLGLRLANPSAGE